VFTPRDLPFDRLADETLVGDALALRLGLHGLYQPLGKPHVDAGGLGTGLPVDRLELCEFEGGEIVVEEGFGLGVSLQVGHFLNNGGPLGRGCVGR